MGVAKVEAVLPFCLIGRVEVVHQPGMVSTVERDFAANTRAEVLPREYHSDNTYTYAMELNVHLASLQRQHSDATMVRDNFMAEFEYVCVIQVRKLRYGRCGQFAVA